MAAADGVRERRGGRRACEHLRRRDARTRASAGTCIREHALRCAGDVTQVQSSACLLGVPRPQSGAQNATRVERGRRTALQPNELKRLGLASLRGPVASNSTKRGSASGRARRLQAARLTRREAARGTRLFFGPVARWPLRSADAAYRRAGRSSQLQVAGAAASTRDMRALYQPPTAMLLRGARRQRDTHQDAVWRRARPASSGQPSAPPGCGALRTPPPSSTPLYTSPNRPTARASQHAAALPPAPPPPAAASAPCAPQSS